MAYFLPTFSASAGWCRCSVRDWTAISPVFRVTANLLSTAELVVSGAGSIDTRTDIQQANGFLLAQELSGLRRLPLVAAVD